MKVTHPYSQRNLGNYPLTTKLKPFVGQNLSPKYCNNRYKQQKWTLKTFRLTSFQTPHFQSVSIFFKLVYTSFLLFLPCYLNPLLTFWAVILMFHSVWWQFPLFEFLYILWQSSLSMIFFSMLFYIDFIRTTCYLALSNLCPAQMLTVMWKQQEKILRNTWPFRVNGGWFHVITVLSHIQSVCSK